MTSIPEGCTCPYGIRPLGRLYGINMGKGRVRLQMTRDCPVHDPKTHTFNPAESKPWSVLPPLCRLCHSGKHRHHRGKATTLTEAKKPYAEQVIDAGLVEIERNGEVGLEVAVKTEDKP